MKKQREVLWPVVIGLRCPVRPSVALYGLLWPSMQCQVRDTRTPIWPCIRPYRALLGRVMAGPARWKAAGRGLAGYQLIWRDRQDSRTARTLDFHIWTETLCQRAPRTLSPIFKHHQEGPYIHTLIFPDVGPGVGVTVSGGV